MSYWIPVSEKLPPAKKGWEHSERVLVRYAAENRENGKTEGYGIAYYHYNPPYRKPSFVDFADSRQPTHWLPIPPVDSKTKEELLKELAELKQKKASLEHQVSTEFSMAARYADEELGTVSSKIVEVETQLQNLMWVIDLSLNEPINTH